MEVRNNNVSFKGFGVIQGAAKDVKQVVNVVGAFDTSRVFGVAKPLLKSFNGDLADAVSVEFFPQKLMADALLIKKGATEVEDLYLVSTGERDCEILNKTKNTPKIYEAVTSWFEENLSNIRTNTEKFTNRDLPIISKAKEILAAGPSEFDHHNVEKINNNWFADYLLGSK